MAGHYGLQPPFQVRIQQRLAIVGFGFFVASRLCEIPPALHNHLHFFLPAFHLFLCDVYFNLPLPDVVHQESSPALLEQFPSMVPLCLVDSNIDFKCIKPNSVSRLCRLEQMVALYHLFLVSLFLVSLPYLEHFHKPVCFLSSHSYSF